MADLALPTLTATPAPTPVGLALPVPTGDAATGATADPFASLIAAMTPVVPTAPVALAIPDTIVLPTIGGEIAAADLPVHNASDDDTDSDTKTPMSDIVALLTFVPPAPITIAAVPPPATPIAAAPAIVTASETPAPRLRAAIAEVTASPAAGTPAPVAPIEADTPKPVADPETPDASEPDARPVRARSPADIIRLLKTSAAQIALAAPVPDAEAQVVTPPAVATVPAEAVPEAAEAVVAEAPRPATPAPTVRRATPAATSAAQAPVARADAATGRDTPVPERHADARRARIETATPVAFVDPRTDIARPADTAGLAPAAPIDDPVARQLDMAKDGQWLDSLARDIAMAGGKDGQLSFRLDPVSLGALTVQISQGQDGASVRLSASTEQARAILADAQPRLIAEARAQGLHLREATVDTSPALASNSAATTSGGGQGRSDQGASAQLQQHQQQQGGRRTPAEPQADATPRRAPSPTPARDSAELYA